MARTAKGLTAIACEKAKPTEKPYKLADSGGLYLLVSQAGRYWRWDYRFAGKRKTMALGVYPEVTLAAARDSHTKARAVLRDGMDPMTEKQAAKRKAATDAENSFRALALKWHAVKSASWAANTAAKALRQMELHLFPAIGHKPVTAITPPELLAALRRIPVKYTATRMREVAGQVFRFGIATGFAERNPAADLRDTLPVPKVKHRPALTSPKEFGQFLRDLKEFQGADRLTLLAARLALLTWVRSQEMRLARWEEIDAEAREWRVPAGRMKMGKGLSQAHIVPLSDAALATLEELRTLSGHTPHLFPNVTGKADHMSENTLGRMLWRLGYKNRQTLHGFRASARSILGERGWSRDALERQLDHAERNKVVAAYARGEHLDERRRLMADWGAVVTALESGQTVLPENVIPLTRAA
ncbi:site-specific recombinase, phage integrase family [Ostertagia ostertagi]